MPLMTKLRESLSTVFAVFAGVFVVYIVLDWGMDITGRRRRGGPSMESQEIGVINDQPIFYKDFSEMVKQVAENQKAQTNNEPDETQLRTIRDQVWNDLVEEKLFDEQIQKFGIAVTDQEIVDWVRGDNPPDFLRQRFTDSTGVFNRQAYVFLQSRMGIPVEKADRGKGRIRVEKIPEQNVVMAIYFGPYEKTAPVYRALDQYCKESGKTIIGGPWEIYVTDPMTEKDPMKVETDIVFPVK